MGPHFRRCGRWQKRPTTRLPDAPPRLPPVQHLANKSGSEAIHSTGLHDIFNSGFGEACDEDRPASQCGSAARNVWSRSITVEFVILLWYYLEFSSYLVRGLLFALVCLFFWFRSFALALVVAAFRRLLFSACSPPLVWLLGPGAVPVFLGFGLSFGVSSSARCFLYFVRLSLFSGRRAHPGGPSELALWRSFSNSRSSTWSL